MNKERITRMRFVIRATASTAITSADLMDGCPDDDVMAQAANKLRDSGAMLAATLADLSRLIKEHDELQDIVAHALPYVEDAKADKCLKPGVAAKFERRMRAAIARMDGGA